MEIAPGASRNGTACLTAYELSRTCGQRSPARRPHHLTDGLHHEEPSPATPPAHTAAAASASPDPPSQESPQTSGAEESPDPVGRPTPERPSGAPEARARPPAAPPPLRPLRPGLRRPQGRRPQLGTFPRAPGERRRALPLPGTRGTPRTPTRGRLPRHSPPAKPPQPGPALTP